jgi:HEAT repeat protein
MLFLFAAGSPANRGPEEQSEAGQAYRDAYGLIIDSNWSAAIEAFEGLIQRYPSSDWVDGSRFWICYATEKTNPAAESSFQCYEAFLKENPRSEWAKDAGMNMVRIANRLVGEGKTEYERKVRRLGNQNEDEVVLLVLMALLDKGDAEVIDRVIQRLDQTENEEVRAKIARMLDDHAEKPVVFDKLVQLARNDPSVKVRRSAIRALSEVDNPRTVEVLKQIISGGDELEVRRTALRELGDMDSQAQELVPYLSQVAQSAADDNLAYAAIHAIGEFEGPGALQSLFSLYESMNTPKRRNMVINTLEDRDDDAAAVMGALQHVNRVLGILPQ